MILSIVAYGTPILRKVSNEIAEDYPNIKTLIDDMWETMYASNGVGLAAPQINKDIRLFIVNSKQILDNLDKDERKIYPNDEGIEQVFINARVIDYDGEEWLYNEGCLSIPKIREDILRQEEVTIEYLDENFKKYIKTFNGISARIIQHEYDHIEGKLFIDYLKPLRKKMLQSKLNDIVKGKIKVDYKMTFTK